MPWYGYVAIFGVLCLAGALVAGGLNSHARGERDEHEDAGIG